MFISLKEDSDLPVYKQIVAAVKEQLHSGEISYGDNLPSVRVLANTLDVNMHTVRHAYKELEAAGIVVVRLGQRARIRPRPSGGRITREVKEKLLTEWRKLEQEAFLCGVGYSELLNLITSHGEKNG